MTHFVRSPVGGTVTNTAFRPGTNRLVMTESAGGCALEAELPAEAAALFATHYDSCNTQGDRQHE